MIRVAKTETTRRREVEYVPDQADLNAGQRTLVADGPESSSAAAQQQQHFQHSPSFPHSPTLAGPHIRWFAEHQGYVADLIRQQQEALQHQLAEMQKQQQAFMRQQQQVINDLITSIKVQAIPCLGATLNSLGSDDAEEFIGDLDGSSMSTAWHNRHDQLLDGEKVRSLGTMTERSRHGCKASEEGSLEAEFQRHTEPVLIRMQQAENDDFAEPNRDEFTPPKHFPERPPNVMVDDEEQSFGMSSTQSGLREYDQYSAGVKTTPGTTQQRALAGPCDARGYDDDVIQYHVLKLHPSTTVLQLHAQSILWSKSTGLWTSENVEFTGLFEVPLSPNVNVNISSLEMQFRSAVIVIGAAAEDQGRMSIIKKIKGSLEPLAVVGDSPGGKFWQRIHSKLEFEPPPSPRRTTLPGEPQKRKFCRNMPDEICVKVGRMMFGTVDLCAVRQAGRFRSGKQMKVNDVSLESRSYTRPSVSGSILPTRFDTTKQPTWSLGRPPDRFGGTGLSASVSSTTSTTTAPSQSAVSFSRCARVLVPIRSSPRRLLMRFDLYHLN